ncbi:hypothetical protein [Sinorhizobium sp. RAC02]|uniref:hypothetical protein n=1 Tax=Sinorhizobium sp. RAC02 TaxID=1842534 RepID=UPI00083E5BC1|nr:hypothetical protein [Sinorhizobium sp. RAC02]AOF90687.1 putative transmembrane protein [Sinorhizobium sp. RAC02]
MTRLVPVLLSMLLLAACTTGAPHSVEPIPGSITYGGQPRSKLTKAPVGSTFDHTFFDNRGRRVVETYQIQPDRSLLLLRRHARIEYLWD